MSDAVRFGVFNTRGLSDEKLQQLRSLLARHQFGFIAALEDHYRERPARRAAPDYLGESRFPNFDKPDEWNVRGGGGGILLLATPAFHQRARVVSGRHFVKVVTAEATYAVLYAPPSMPLWLFAELLDAVADADVVAGDFNVRLGSVLAAGGRDGPRERADAVAAWMQRAGLRVVEAPGSRDSLDHLFVKHARAAELEFVSSLDAGLDTDHPMLRCSLVDAAPAGAAPATESARRFHIRLLRSAVKRQELRMAYDALAYQVEAERALCEDVLRTSTSAAERADAVEAYDHLLVHVIRAAAEHALGSYDVGDARRRPDHRAVDLAASASPADAVLLWKRAKRGRQRRIVVRPDAPDDGRTPLEDVVDVWRQQWRSDEPPVPPPDAVAPDGPVDWAMAGLTARFTGDAVDRFSRRYPKHKATSLDGVHASIVDVLCRGSDEDAVGDEHLMPTEPPAREHPLSEHLAALCRYVTVACHYPARWGKFPVTLLPKEREGDPHAGSVRPLAVQPFFRLVYEGVAQRFFASDEGWTKLHPAQAGFRRGFSTLTTLATSEHEAAVGDCRVKTYLDYSRAYDSARAKYVIDAFRQRDCPPVLLPLIWSVLTSGLAAVIVVNGERSAPVPLGIGLPQGGILSTTFWDVLVDPLVRRLNAGAAPGRYPAHFFADDQSMRTADAAAAQRLVDVSVAWADEVEMAHNWGKCAVIAPFPVEIRLRPGQRPLRQVESYKFLGVPETVDGLDVAGHLARTTEKAAGSLASLRAAGGAWPPASRLALYRTFCRPMVDYAAGWAHHWLAADRFARQRYAGVVRLVGVHEAAVRWICGVSDATSVAVCEALTGLMAPLARLEQLSLSLGVHLRRANDDCPVHAFLDEERHGASPSALIAGLQRSPIRLAYDAAVRDAVAAEDEPPSVASFCRAERRRWLADPARGRMAQYVAAGPHRLPALVDRVLVIPDARRRHLAILWRCNKFGMQRRGTLCPCGAPWRRSHAHCLIRRVGGLVSADGLVDVDLAADLERRAARAWSEYQAEHGLYVAGADDDPGTFGVVDFLLGHADEDLADIALHTLDAFARLLGLGDGIEVADED